MKYKEKCLYVFLIAIILLNLSIIYATNKNIERLDNFFRLHVVVNSDNVEDQMLKLIISKELEDYISNITNNSKSKAESKEIITENIYSILNLCKKIINENGYDYIVKANIGNIQYDLKTYNQTDFEKGIYDSLKIIIGDGKGTNWWSLIYPSNINIEEYEDNKVIFSFKIIELFRDLFKKEEGINPSSLIIYIC